MAGILPGNSIGEWAGGRIRIEPDGTGSFIDAGGRTTPIVKPNFVNEKERRLEERITDLENRIIKLEGSNGN